RMPVQFATGCGAMRRLRPPVGAAYGTALKLAPPLPRMPRSFPWSISTIAGSAAFARRIVTSAGTASDSAAAETNARRLGEGRRALFDDPGTGKDSRARIVIGLII